MSRTTKGSRKSGADNYPTPQWGIERFLEEWEDLHEVGPRWLEPAVGDGVIVETVNRHRGGLDWTCCDIRDTRPALRKVGLNGEVRIGDFFEFPEFQPPASPAVKPWDVAILNPPFRLTLDFILRCQALASCVVVLQRMNYCGSATRNVFFRETMPDLYVIPDRMSFTGDGKADACEHAWHVWGPLKSSNAGMVRVLATTPKTERKRSRRRIVRARDEVGVAIESLFHDAMENTFEEVAGWSGPLDGDLWAPEEATP